MNDATTRIICALCLIWCCAFGAAVAQPPKPAAADAAGSPPETRGQFATSAKGAATSALAPAWPAEFAARLKGAGLPPVAAAPRRFASSDEHYRFLLEQAHGGTQYNDETVPKWWGLWTPGGNSLSEGHMFVIGERGFMQGGGVIISGVLTPAYEKQYRHRRELMDKYGEQPYDRLTACETPGYPRWLWEPYAKEFVNTSRQSWMLFDTMNETRRVYIGQEHKNVFGTHSWDGDTIGFWNGQKLITQTKFLYPGEYFRGMPLTSNQFESVETWEKKTLPDGTERLEVQVTFYDSLGLQRPLDAVYTFIRSRALENIGTRIRTWECARTSNNKPASGGEQEGRDATSLILPGEPGFKDPDGFSDYPDLPGQSYNPLAGSQSPDGFPK